MSDQTGCRRSHEAVRAPRCAQRQARPRPAQRPRRRPRSTAPAAVAAALGIAACAAAPAAGDPVGVAAIDAALAALQPREGLAPRIDAWLEREIGSAAALARDLHAHPELSFEEQRTAAKVADALEAAGYAVTRGVGRTGVVGVLKGAAPAAATAAPARTLLLRGDMDALPVTEATGLPYASRVRAKRPDGSETGVMHACGHDLHTANLIASARLMAALRDAWRGTLVVVAQPAEEIGRGALAMIEDGLFERFPRPDVALALHADAELPAGTLGLTEGWAAANVDSVDIVVHGRGGHGARPHQAVDPIVTAAHLVTALQTIVSRRIAPREPAVVTVGSIHGGSKHNVIPDEVRLQLTVRSYSDAVRSQLLTSIEQIAQDTCRTFRCPKPPDVRIKDEFTPSMYNHPGLTRAARRVWNRIFGAQRVRERPPSMGGEDFARYSRVLGIPALQYRLGTVDPERHAAAQAPGAEPLPSLHSSRYAPALEPSLRTAVRSMSHLALALLAP